MKEILIRLIGEYSPKTIETAEGVQTVVPDMAFILSAIMLIVIIFCLFRFIGGIFKS